ncbi:MAG: hypothetical protein COT89_01855 [Candidatus Colwellbacteria bacterium CG10_big_fil_rev_8_21_14_0_10_42_22]|uniref:DNA polymerase III delta N-terminal domain-containing protein n=1 Tax=Candidatus Colwellbacteria bacterium CG10_big_fil_rev_8_21_14_0_10_42_22 TaxID=1974540 RepID=A0A2H0VFU2_9BACT|nr:MAG: hypothetical protein COT89_01855 [Candidatus Colwellbacteria bacterium CG10_big_fil_rev_8_21_14_0_10_42_22]
MIITLYGPDSYRRIKKLNELVNLFIEKRGAISHERFDLETNEDLGPPERFLGTPSMFSSKKLVVLDNPFENVDTRGLKKILKKYTEDKDTNIIINTRKKFTATFKFLIQSPNKFEEYQELEGLALDRFIDKEATNLGLKININDKNLIKESFGSNSWRISTELECLALTSKKVVGIKEEKISYFNAINTIKGWSGPPQKVVALENLMSINRLEAERIFNGLAFQLRSQAEANMYADYNAAARAGRLDYDEALVAVALGLQFNPLEW